MNALVIYDSFFGNTEKIARAVAEALGPETRLARPAEITPDQLRGLDLIVVGSPTRGFRPSQATQAFLKTLAPGSLSGVKAAAFDTRIPMTGKVPGFLRFMVKIFGYAADPIGKRLAAAGGSLVRTPEGFLVNDTEGPLADGELERAAAWGRSLA